MLRQKVKQEVREHLLRSTQVINHSTSLQDPHICIYCGKGLAVSLFSSSENINTHTPHKILEVIVLGLVRPIIFRPSFPFDRTSGKTASNAFNMQTKFLNRL